LKDKKLRPTIIQPETIRAEAISFCSFILLPLTDMLRYLNIPQMKMGLGLLAFANI
jgi:hypothetical protein